VYPQPLPSPKDTVPTPDGASTFLDAVYSQTQQQTMLPSPVDIEPQVLKLIKKYDVQLLCLQHNPVSIFVFLGV